MATTKATAALVNKVWAKDLFVAAKKDMFFDSFSGKDENSIIHIKEDLTKSKGDQITIGLAMKLTGAGTDGDSTLEGNEEQMVFYDMPVTVNQKRHAVRLEGALEEQKAAFDLRSTAKNALKVWLQEYIDGNWFVVLSANPTATMIVRPTGAANDDAIDGTKKMSTTVISKAKRKAMMSNPKVRPTIVKGKRYYVLVISPWQARDLRDDQKWIDAQLNIGVKGDENPIFSGMLGIWDGVVVHEHENVVLFNNSTPLQCGRALFLGAQAGVWAIAKRPFWKEKEFDYDNQVGFATGLIHGQAKSKFNNKDFAVIQIITAAVADD